MAENASVVALGGGPSRAIGWSWTLLRTRVTRLRVIPRKYAIASGRVRPLPMSDRVMACR